PELLRKYKIADYARVEYNHYNYEKTKGFLAIFEDQQPPLRCVGFFKEDTPVSACSGPDWGVGYCFPAYLNA
ncbi:MAG: hypothetical protein QME81_13170, partial [bacterium]|nr:hypothetical protein [bacterium]